MISELSGILALRYSCRELFPLQVQESALGFGVVVVVAAWSRGIVFSHRLMGKVWALHTGDTKSAARDTLLDASR